MTKDKGPGCVWYPNRLFGAIVISREEGIFFAAPKHEDPIDAVGEADRAIEDGSYSLWHMHKIEDCNHD